MILDWVPAHFPRDDFALARFDGTALYEHADPRRGAHPDWGTLVFNYGRHEVRNFLVANALYWLREYHADGIRVDAVASMLYLDYSREEGEWVPNQYGGNEDLDAVEFLKELNEVLYGREPGAISAAEESTAWPGVSRPTYLGGLGFGFKWNMGWMHDTLAYFQQDPVYRRWHHHELTFSLVYAFTENFILPLSHDEVVHGKGSLLTQDAGRQVAEAREPALAVRLHVGAPRQEAAVHGLRVRAGGRVEPRALARLAPARGPAARRRAVARARPQPRLQGRAGAVGDRLRGRGFWWIEASDADSNVFAFARRTRDSERVVVYVSNLSPLPREGYRLGLPRPGRWRELVNTDSGFYGGSDVGNLGGVEAGAAVVAGPAVLGRDQPAAARHPLARAGATDGGRAACRVVRGRRLTNTARLVPRTYAPRSGTRDHAVCPGHLARAEDLEAVGRAGRGAARRTVARAPASSGPDASRRWSDTVPRTAGTIEPLDPGALARRLRTRSRPHRGAGRDHGLVTMVCVRVRTRKRVAPSRLSIVNR